MTTSRTIPDWLAHAGAAAETAEVDRCLEQAISQATSSYDGRTLLRGIAALPLASRERVAEIANLTLELARAERDLWGFRDVATARATRLDDMAGSRAALDACAEGFREPRTDTLGEAAEMLGLPMSPRGYEWVLLGQGYLETLQDGEGMRRCLEAGREMARARKNADDLCAIAAEWASRVDRNAGVALLLEAEALASNGSAQPWTLANAWHALGDSAAVHRVLDGALREAESTDAALHVARAWSSHGESDEARRAVERAQALATTAAEWLETGEVAFDAKLGEAPIRHALERAEALVMTTASESESEVGAALDIEALRGRVARAYRQWLHDDAAAARVGPPGLRPEALRERARTLDGWETSAAGLFDWLRGRATPDMLARIASADYGTGAEKHLAALRDICETGLVPRSLEWEPHEVLALTRWSSGEGVDHLERAFCCVLLCLSPADLDELVTNGPILAESCLALGAEPSHLAELFFAWLAETEPPGEAADPDDMGPEQPVALLLLFLLRAVFAPGDPLLEPLAAMLAEHPSAPLETLVEQMAGSMRAELWNELLSRVLEPVRGTHPPAARVLRALGR